MSYLQGPDRSQVQLLPPCLDDYVAPGCAARFIDAFVDGLDLQGLGFERSQPAQTGRPGYHPSDMLKLYIYGYLNRIRSSRRLEAEASRNLELIWLLRGIKPDFKTIADFRKDNRKCFGSVLKQFNLLCRKMDLFGAELVAIDGSKFKAVNSARRHYSQEQLRELIGTIEERIAQYLGELDEQDGQMEGVADGPTAAQLKEKVAQLKERSGRYEGLLEEMSQAQATEISLTDADSRGMKKVGVGYNVQVAADAKHDLIVCTEVVQAANDCGQLSSMARKAQEDLGGGPIGVVADAGYHEANQLQACEQAGIPTYVSQPGSTSGKGPKGQEVYPKEDFKYDARHDAYICPQGQTLERGYQTQSRGKERLYYYNVKACGACEFRKQCTTAPYRKISRLENEDVIERQAQRTQSRPDIIKKRKAIIEHIFGTLRGWGHDDFLMKGLEKVGAEIHLSALTYNLRRVIGLVRLDRWMSVAGQTG